MTCPPWKSLPWKRAALTVPTKKKLRIIKEYGATRISINPQTFSDEVLRNIGRRHTAQDILDCYRTARRVGHDNINMDLIAGLPGDTVEGFRHSLQTAIDLDPENITVHTLTLKRASNLVVEHRAADYADVAAMVESCELLEKSRLPPLLPVPPKRHPAKPGKRGLVQAGVRVPV